MNHRLEDFAREWNPLNDFKYFKFKNTTKEKDPIRHRVASYNNNVIYVLSAVKPLARGFFIGLASGGIVSLFSEEKIIDNSMSYAMIGSNIDLTQYVVRGAYYYLKEQFYPSSKE